MSTDFLKIMEERFFTAFGRDIAPLHLAEAPGRVNLIGEHIDYNGYSVLPMALHQRVRILFHVDRQKEGIHLVNTNPQFEDFHSDANDIVIDSQHPKWHHYFMCAYQGVADYARDNHLTLPLFQVSAVVHGDIPHSAGLSSSSALVVCSALVIVSCCQFHIDKRELAQMCAKCERYIGTQGGGMDQAVSLLAQEGKALHIVFNDPIETDPVPLPEDVSVVVAHCGSEMHKAATSEFNERVVECRLAAKLLTFLLAREGDNWRTVQRLQEVQHLTHKGSPSEMHIAVEQLLHPEPYTREELMELWQIPTVEDFQASFLTANTQNKHEFKLRQRADHVFTEAFRVEEFQKLCQHGVEMPNAAFDVGTALGQVMTASHKSCSDWYECSCPALDKLVQICLDGGALGSRLTGAGWGGCAIALVKNQSIQDFMNYVLQHYYGVDSASGDTSGILGKSIFVSKPAGGAEITENVLFQHH